MNPERDFRMEPTEDIDRAHDECPDDETRKRLGDLRCKIDERVRTLYRQARPTANEETR